MARDYKHRSRRKRRTSTSPPWVWLAVGLLVGLFVAFLTYLQMRPQQQQADNGDPVALPVPRQDEASQPPARPPSVPEPPAPEPPRPRFDFYNLLPEMEVIVPEREITGSPTQEGVKRVEQPGTYLLQAASFRGREQADQLRARLAMLGLETSVQTVTINDRESWHRVLVGPFSNLSDLNKARALLQKNGVDAILIRLKG
jgi:cell division protein FtsN